MEMPGSLADFESSFKETVYTYNGINQLTNITIGTLNAAYGYNGDGLRTSKIVDGIKTTHILDGQNIAAEIDGQGKTTEYIRGINLIASVEGANKKFYLYNGHGDVVHITDSTGNVIKNYEYDAFGNEKNIDVNDKNPFRYGGEYFDKETGLIYLRARYYDPKIGRFISEDSYWGKDNDPLSLNLYTYCQNDGVNFFDPSGHRPVEVYQGDEDTGGVKTSFIKNTVAYKYFTKITQDGDWSLFFNLSGFARDEEGIYHAKQDGWQSWKYIGYNSLYDVAFDLATSMDKTEFPFSAGGEEFVIKLWKGDYLNLGAGAEMGIYYGGRPHWLTGVDYAMPMTIGLYDKDGDSSFYWIPFEDNWWVTGFDPNYQNAKASNLTSFGSIDFSDHLDMWNAFYEKYQDNTTWTFDPKNHSASFSW